jgi:hypothetical protein
MTESYSPDDWYYTVVEHKRPTMPEWQNNPLNLDDVFDHLTERRWTGYGLLLGEQSGGTMALDVDGPEAQEYLSTIIDIDELNALGACSWTSGKEGRIQYAFRVPEEYWSLLKMKKIGPKGSLEFRWNGGQSVLPPSEHPDTGRYEWVQDMTQDNTHVDLPDLLLAKWIEACYVTSPKLSSSEDSDVDHEPITNTDADEVIAVIKEDIGNLDYDSWMKITYALCHEVGKVECVNIMRSHYPEQKKGEYQKLLKTWNKERSPKFGTLGHYLKQSSKGVLLLSKLNAVQDKARVIVQNSEDTGITVDYIDADCGAGKSYSTLQKMANEGKMYVYACDKIANIDQRKAEFLQMIAHDAASWNVIDVYYNKMGKEGTEIDISTTVQLNSQLIYLNDRGTTKKTVVFITHATLQLYHWRGWYNYNLIIDEVPNVTYSYVRSFAETDDVLKRYIRTKSDEGDCYALELTDYGDETAGQSVDDVLIQEFEYLLHQLQHDNTKVWVQKKGWDDPTSDKLRFFSVFTPVSLVNFESILLLGDRCSEMVIYEVWKSSFKVTWNKVNWSSSRTPRKVPLKDRATVYYFQDKRPSIQQASSATTPANKIAKYVAEKEKVVLWTVNAVVKSKSKLVDVLDKDDAITPKSHGINTLQHHTACLWMACMNPNNVEVKQYMDYVGMTQQQLVQDRELNAVYQFAMRTNLRDWDSTKHVNIYVWSLDQAEYLKDRLGCDIKLIPNVISEPNGGGRPKGSVKTESLSDVQRSKKSRLIKKYGKEQGLKFFKLYLTDPDKLKLEEKVYRTKMAFSL